ncbi:GntR family transcriptional regulator [Mycolicibacterium stellerae]|uniref:GntR family transcriptional regulator n=1 Tax=Mycolicibacterium stellerae TaxID=2358193 RepID=UPI000F0AFDB6|nr:GntR family transcriptional regulator [Mycolicibacterium stellerae]
MTTRTEGLAGGMDAIAPISRSTVRDAVRDALRDLIISGGVDTDVPLRQDELAARLNVSRTPLREALHGLASEGLVTIDPRRGAVVTKPTVKQLLDLYEIREQLEVYAGRKVVALADTTHIGEIAAINDRMAAVDDPVAWAQLNQQFHAAIYAPCANVELVALIGTLAARAKFYVRILVSSRPPALDAVHGHQEMLDALRAGDADAMEAAIRRHLRSTVEHVAPTLPE